MARDVDLLTDLSLHHVMTREQIIRLGYFESVSRANARLFKLRHAGLVRLVQPTDFVTSRSHLYTASQKAAQMLDNRVARVLEARSFTPRFIDHSLATVDLKCELRRLGMTAWRAETQVRHTYEVRTGTTRRVEDLRPDGLAFFGDRLVFVEVDRGHTSRPRIKAKLELYQSYLARGVFGTTYSTHSFHLLVTTTGSLRKRHLIQSKPKGLHFGLSIRTHEEIRSFTTIAEVLS